MKLTKSAMEELARILDHMKAAEDYVMSDDVVVAHKSHGTTTLEFSRYADGKPEFMAPVVKEYGSDLCRVNTARVQLARFLDRHYFHAKG